VQVRRKQLVLFLNIDKQLIRMHRDNKICKAFSTDTMCRLFACNIG
jgi:hypothetical protein